MKAFSRQAANGCDYSTSGGYHFTYVPLNFDRFTILVVLFVFYIWVGLDLLEAFPCTTPKMVGNFLCGLNLLFLKMVAVPSDSVVYYYRLVLVSDDCSYDVGVPLFFVWSLFRRFAVCVRFRFGRNIHVRSYYFHNSAHLLK